MRAAPQGAERRPPGPRSRLGPAGMQMPPPPPAVPAAPATTVMEVCLVMKYRVSFSM